MTTPGRVATIAAMGRKQLAIFAAVIGRAGALAVVAAAAALPAAAQARELEVDVKFDKLEANIGAIPGLPDGIVDAAFRDTDTGGGRERGKVIDDQLKAVYLVTTPEERKKDKTSSYFEWHMVGSKPSDEEPDSLRGELTVKKNYIPAAPGHQAKTFRGHWTIVDGKGYYGALFRKGGSGRVLGKDDCTASGCRGYIRFKGTLR
jgi:hypothetical protein